MNATPQDRMTADRRRHALALGIVNGALWAAGNGLTTGAVVVYLAQELGAKGVGVSMIIAAPSLAGLLRLVTPRLIVALAGVKRTCLIFSALAYLLLALGLPAVFCAAGGSRRTTLAVLIALVCVHQLLEYIGTVALWSWLSALVPLRIRGRYFGRRQAWQMAALAPALLASGLFIDHWKEAHRATDPERTLVGYGVTTGIGAWLLVGSLVPLALMPGVSTSRRPGGTSTTTSMFAPLTDAPFRRLLAYRAWFSFFNGVSQAALNIYPRAVLQFGVLPMQLLPFGTRLGQLVASPAVGKASDRVGNRPVLIASQVVVATGPLFYLAATPAARWWIIGAWIAYAAYAGTNICLPNLMLKLAPRVDNTPFIAMAETISGLAYGVSVMAGGVLFDALAARGWTIEMGPLALDHFGLLFLIGAITRAVGVVWLLRIPERGACTWREILGHRLSPVEES